MSGGGFVLVSGELEEDEMEGDFVMSRGSVCAMERMCVSF